MEERGEGKRCVVEGYIRAYFPDLFEIGGNGGFPGNPIVSSSSPAQKEEDMAMALPNVSGRVAAT